MTEAFLAFEEAAMDNTVAAKAQLILYINYHTILLRLRPGLLIFGTLPELRNGLVKIE